MGVSYWAWSWGWGSHQEEVLLCWEGIHLEGIQGTTLEGGPCLGLSCLEEAC